MVDYREILRLKSLKYSNKDIAASVHHARNTVSEVLNIADSLRIHWPLDENVCVFCELSQRPGTCKRADKHQADRIFAV